MKKLPPGFSPTSRSPSGITTALGSLLRPAKNLGPKTAEEVRKRLEAVKRSEAGFLVVIARHSYMGDDLLLPLIRFDPGGR
jgi:hypothetical protein